MTNNAKTAGKKEYRPWWFPFEPAKYMGGAIAFCSDTTQGIFIRIICLCHQRDGELPRDATSLGRVIMSDPETLEAALLELEKHEILQPTKPGYFTIKFVYDALEDHYRLHKKAVKDGTKGAETRYGKPIKK